MFRAIFIIFIFTTSIAAQKTVPTPNRLTKAEIKTDIVFKDLPQTIPGKPRATTDAQDARLKGKVKVVTHRYFDGANQRTHTLESHYNKRGDLVRVLFYDVTGNLSSVNYFGYVKDKRVSLKTFPSDKDQKLPSAGYDTEYSYKYEFGKMTGKIVQDEHQKENYGYGAIGSGILINYENTQRDFSSMSMIDLNDKNDLASRVYHENEPGTKSPRITTRYKYAYEKYDDKGNWLGVTIDETTVNDRAIRSYHTFRETREITYY